ncbi:histidine kinase [Agromyces endophyticus]|uniref:sensor histidine kinase n=1 Tax=Agromyces sp. H17E-10 TaxID=2932244 RepID=UPI001FD08A56|nr:histidine kinase [Agromyces sp. H17E-10]UOQ90156.1 histidine kinase [Agromyces sp. H17E-10]
MTSPASALWHAPAAAPPPPRRVWRDWVLVGLVMALALVEVALRTDVPWRWLWAVVLVALAPTLLWRRTRPFTMLAIAFGAGTAVSLATGGDSQLFTTAYFLVLVYATFRWGSGRALIGGAALVVAGVLLEYVGGAPPLGDVIGGVAVATLTCTLGVAFRWRAGSRARELDRARLLEREQLARDLHDTVAHHVSAIAIQAQAGTAVARADPAAAAEVLRVIEIEASRTLDEMRAIVRVLRRPDSAASGRDAAPAADLAPLPGIADLRALAAGDGSPVVDVQLEGDVDALPPVVAATVFRLAQEGVTNARRHARGATRVDVRVLADADGVRLSVQNDGEPEASAQPGFGLTGMAERAALLGGTCQAGPAPRGGWAVTANLPRAGWSS